MMTDLHTNGRLTCLVFVACVWCGSCFVMPSSSLGMPPADEVIYSRDVLPLLARRCFACHGPDDAHREADLRLDVAVEGDAIKRERPTIVPGQPDASELLRRIVSSDPSERMPPPETGAALSDREASILRKWIQQGAARTEHWAFTPIRRPLVPSPESNVAAPRNPIDAFVHRELTARRMTPSPEADKATLLRRLSLDLRGLPPELEVVEDLLDGSSEETAAPDWLDRLVERWLASPKFGERWGRHWLDVARYSDSTGFETDAPRTHWKYRDWVVDAVNRDLSFDQFVIDQLAGDLTPNADESRRIATGFLLCGPRDGGSEAARFDANAERMNTFGGAFLGLTLACAQCHSHKFDPLSQQDYYGLFAFLNDADEGQIEFADPDELARRNALRSQVESLDKELREYVAKLPPEAVALDAGKREREKLIAELRGRIPQFTSAAVLQQPAAPRPTHRYERGEFTNPRELVTPNTPTVLPPLADGPRTRLELATWLTSSSHPLTARVTVNRFWQSLFGRGIVETESDFGVQGSPPTHPELLDWLAADFREHDWSVKRAVRQILGSATYRQSSVRRTELEPLDPDNRWLARQARLRLDAEAVRDQALYVSGLLVERIGGPTVFPYQADGVLVNRATPATWAISSGGDQFRRTLYTHHWRLTPHPLFVTFDAPDSLTACTRRRPTNTPLQALTLLHGPEFLSCAESLASRDSELSGDSRLQRLVRRTLGRDPSEAERTILRRMVVSSAASEETVANQAASASAWIQVARTLLNLDEAIMRE